mgnify:CR=1 FL=1
MARPNERAEKAKELYLQGKKLVEIANILGVPPGTVRRWKSEQVWDGERSGAAASARKKRERSGKPKEKLTREEVQKVVDNPDLTSKQQKFCLLYIRLFNATKAYQRAYECSYSTAMVEGSKLLRNPKVQETIQDLKQGRLSRELLDESDIFQKYTEIAFADLTDFVTFSQEEVPVMGAFGPVMGKDEETGEDVPLTKTVNVVRAKGSEEVDGTLLAEVSQGKDGFKIKLADRMKALAWLADHMDLATAEQQARIEKMKVETERAHRLSGADADLEDDPITQALKEEGHGIL